MTLKILMRNFLLGMLLFLVVQGSVAAQNPGIYISSANEKERAESLLKTLEEGVLIVRLNSDRRKIDELNRLANSPDTDENAKKRFNKMLEATLEDNRTENQAIMEAVRLNYDFTSTLFMYDTASHLLQADVKSGYFLNENLEVDNSITLEHSGWLMLYLQREPPTLFFVLDQENDEVGKPFPIPVRPGFGRHSYVTADGEQERFFLMLSFNENKQGRYFSAMLSSWNERLKKYQQQLKEDRN